MSIPFLYNLIRKKSFYMENELIIRAQAHDEGAVILLMEKYKGLIHKAASQNHLRSIKSAVQVCFLCWIKSRYLESHSDIFLSKDQYSSSWVFA